MLEASRPGAGIAFEDWDTLLGAVTARLRESVSATLPHALNGATAPLQASVLECADALDQLQATLSLALAQPTSLVWRDGGDDATLVQAAVNAAAPDPVVAPQP